MSDLNIRDPKLAEAIKDYPDLVKHLIAFTTEPSVSKLLRAGGQMEGTISYNIRKGQVVSFVPGLELKLGYEV